MGPDRDPGRIERTLCARVTAPRWWDRQTRDSQDMWWIQLELPVFKSFPCSRRRRCRHPRGSRKRCRDERGNYGKKER